ncbi:MAG: hypothetical protein HDQ96_03755 [Lachnospiraceae bacterium]|nr:hypothetical protein [Lachnospiraceae bacterium]
MKRAGIYLWMMIKRMGKHPVYWFLLLLFPAAVFAVPKFNRAADEERIPVGYVMEEQCGQTEADETAQKDQDSYDQYLPKLLEHELSEGTDSIAKTSEWSEPAAIQGEREIAETDSIFKYIKYTDINKLKEDIETGEVSCGVVFHENFTEKLRQQDYYHCITLYLPEGMNVGGMVQEDLFRRVYRVYSAVWYAELLESYGSRITPEEVLQKFSEYQKEGKVFEVDYKVQAENNETLYHYSENGKEVSILSLRGILAFLTLMSALLGALDGSRDKKRNSGKGISCPQSLTMAAAGAPILMATLFLVSGMLYYDFKMTYVSYIDGQAGESAGIALNRLIQAKMLPELSSAFLYGFVLWLLAVMISRLLPEKLLEGAMPCFLLIVLLCCPIFFDLGETIPMIGHLSKLFQITWYLEFWG